MDKRYEEMVALAECLANDFDHLRVDMYDADDSIWVGELTLYSWDGLSPRPTCTGRLGGAAAAGRRRHFFFAELLLADRRRTLELGRSAPMLTAASPDRAAAMVPAPVKRSELPGHRQRSQIPQHQQWYSVNRLRCRHARARGGADSSAL